MTAMTFEKTVFDVMNQGLLIVDREYKVVEVNAWFINAVNMPHQALVQRNIFELFQFKQEPFLKQAINQAIDSGLSSFLSNALHPRLFPLYNRYQNCDRLIEQSCTIKAITCNGRPYCLIDIQDISNMVQRETLLSKTSNSLQLFNIAVEHSASSIVITNNNGIIEYVNPKFVEIAGFTLEEAMHNSYFSLSCQTHEMQFETSVLNAIQERGKWHGERSFVTKSGVKYWVEENIYQVCNANNVPTHLVAIQDDLTQLRNIARQASYQASHDSLTGLTNRKEFESILVERIELSPKSDDAVLCFLDIDQFKIVNDTSGHGAGDELLRQISVIIEDNYSNDKLMARLGGDEFAVILRNTDVESAIALGEKLISTLLDFRFRWEDTVFTIGMSIGICQIDETVVSAAEAIKQAESACDAAKEMGRNCVYLYQEDDKALVQRQGDTYWAKKINEALEMNSFLLYAQLIAPLQHTTKASYEILVRMKDSDGNAIAPGFFLPAAERFNLSHRIDRWVINSTLEWMKQHGGKIDHIDHISINLSGLSLSNETLLSYIIDSFTNSNIAPEKICFEITETAAIANLVQAKHFIKTLKSHGCKFALDDFGSGLSSFAYLKNLKVDLLKIDGMFVKDLTRDVIDEAMVKSINDVGHVMGMETIAEFVEDDEVKRRLIELGVDYGQGYGLGKPVPIDSILSNTIEFA